MTYKKALLIKFRHHGDVLLTSPVVNKLKDEYPGIDVCVLVYSETEDMIKYHPQVSKVFSVDRNWKKDGVGYQIKKERELYRQLSTEGFDLVVNMCDSWRAAVLSKLLKPKFSVSELHLKRDNRFWKWCFSALTPESSGGQMHTITRNLLPLTALGIDIENDIKLDMGISPEASDKIAEIFSLNFPEDSKLAVVHPGARWEFKCWDNKRWVETINYLLGKGFRIFITGSPNATEMKDAAEIVGALDSTGVVNLCGELTLQTLAACVQRADIFIGVDSAPMHMASALNIPTVAVFGPTFVEEWSPKAEKAVVVRDPSLTIKPDTVDTSTAERMTLGVSVKMVTSAIDSVL